MSLPSSALSAPSTMSAPSALSAPSTVSAPSSSSKLFRKRGRRRVTAVTGGIDVSVVTGSIDKQEVRHFVLHYSMSGLGNILMFQTSCICVYKSTRNRGQLCTHVHSCRIDYILIAIRRNNLVVVAI